MVDGRIIAARDAVSTRTGVLHYAHNYVGKLFKSLKTILSSSNIMRQPTNSNVKLPRKLLDELGIDGKLLFMPSV